MNHSLELHLIQTLKTVLLSRPQEYFLQPHMLCQKKKVTSQRATGIIQSSILISEQESSVARVPDSVARVPSSSFPELSQLGA